MVLLSSCGDHNATYDDDTIIARTSDGFLSTMSTSSTFGKDFTMAATFTGAKTIWRYRANEDMDVRLSYLLSVAEGGKAKLVLITPDNEVVILTENINNSVMDEPRAETITIKKGNNRIKIVGQDSPKLELKINAEVGRFGDDD